MTPLGSHSLYVNVLSPNQLMVRVAGAVMQMSQEQRTRQVKLWEQTEDFTLQSSIYTKHRI